MVWATKEMGKAASGELFPKCIGPGIEFRNASTAAGALPVDMVSEWLT
jgi:hypothetical protein